MKKKTPGLWFEGPQARQRKLRAAAFWGSESLASRIRECNDEDRSKLELLCDYYRIQHGATMFYDLALALAREIYPEPKKRGRKTKWTDLNKAALVVELERLIDRNDASRGVAWACKELCGREPWASFIEEKEDGTISPDPAEALRQIYFEFHDNRFAKVARDAFKGYEHEGAISEWEKLVFDSVKNPHPD